MADDPDQVEVDNRPGATNAGSTDSVLATIIQRTALRLLESDNFDDNDVKELQELMMSADTINSNALQRILSREARKR